MNHYNPSHTPNPEEWLKLDEQLRIELVEEYHLVEQSGETNSRVHAAFHAIVENQIAQNLVPVVRAMTRLTAEGLSRHDAIHAIGSVLAEHIYDLFGAEENQNDSAIIYNAAVERLTAKSWRKKNK